METRTADNSQPGALAAMLAVDEAAARLWEPQELAGILRHQLAAPLGFDLASANPASAEQVSRLSQSAQPALIHTFSDLLHHPAPPIQLLVLAKDFAKTSRQDPHSPLPQEIAAVIYFAAIAVAQRLYGKRITALGEGAVREGIDWVLAQPWVDGKTRSLFQTESQ
jgi:hypothetical protein